MPQGYYPTNSFIKGYIPWNKTAGYIQTCPKCGKVKRRPPSESHIVHCSSRCAKLGTKFSAIHKKNHIMAIARGESHYLYKPPEKRERKDKRNDPAYKGWVRAVKKRDKNKCQLGDENCQGYMISHHILPWAKYPEQRYKLINGIVLCQFHHPKTRGQEERLIPTFQKLVGSNH